MNARTRDDRRRTGRRVLISLLVTLLLLGGLAGAGAYLWSHYGDGISQTLGWSTNDYEGEGSGEVVVVITEGEIGEDIAASLEEADVVKTADAFYSLLLEQPEEVAFLPGSYKVKSQMSAQAALDALQNPDNRMAFTAIIPEGKTVEQTLELVAAGASIPIEELQAATEDVAAYGLPEGVDSLEGWLFPATYEFEEDTTGAEAIAELVSTQIQVLDEMGVAPESREAVLTKASIVQREGGRIEDFPKVARVIENRLAQDMLLQMDSTAQYGYGQHADGSVWSTDEALADDNPWNTYVHKGLPKGPIANPGRDAISAVLSPPAGDWIYFVAVNLETGESVFSTTQEEHESAIGQLNEWCAANPDQGC